MLDISEIMTLMRGLTQELLCLFCLVCCCCDTSYIVSVHIQCQASMYIRSLCRGHSWRRVRLAKQETLTPPGHLVSPLVCRGPWISTVVLYCWCHSDTASVLLYFTFSHTCSLCRVELVVQWRRVRLAKQEMLTPPGHLVSPLVCMGLWMSTMVLYCWCHSDSASVLLYFTFVSIL